MSRKTFVPWTIAPLQRVKAETVTDPEEIAAMERLRKRLKRKGKGRKTNSGRNGAKSPAGTSAKRRK